MATNLRGQAGTRIISALEGVWAEIRARHPEVQPAVMITGSGTGKRRKKGLTMGSHSADRWFSDPNNPLDPEVFLAGETIAMGSKDVLETLLHEAAHALCAARGVRDTSAQGNRYHNKEFAKAAKELGLEPPQRGAPVVGFSECLLTADTLRQYGKQLGALERATLPYLPYGDKAGEQAPKPEEEDPTKKTSRRQRVVCKCEPERVLQLTPKALRDGPIICGVCTEHFELKPLEKKPEEEAGPPAPVKG